jgi:hypothetical protein
MAIYSYGFRSAQKDPAEFELFCNNIDLLIERRAEILACADYLHCQLSFAWCSWPYISGDGILPLGYLLIGWRDGVLVEQCQTCRQEAQILNFGGSPLTGRSCWSGYCRWCSARQSGSPLSSAKRLHDLMDFVHAMRARYPSSIATWEEYDGFIFSWSGNGLQPARRKRLVVTNTSEPVDLETLLQEIKSGAVRQGPPPIPSLQNAGIGLKLSGKKAP